MPSKAKIMDFNFIFLIFNDLIKGKYLKSIMSRSFNEMSYFVTFCHIEMVKFENFPSLPAVFPDLYLTYPCFLFAKTE